MKKVGKSSNGTALYECICPNCGIIRAQDKRKIGTRCAKCAGVFKRTHGLSGTKLYKVLVGMRARCSTPSATHYEYYGGRGISVHEEWEKPEAFFRWAKENGYAEGLEIDRIDVNGNYCPDNCRFVSKKENNRTSRNTKCTPEKAKEVKELSSKGFDVKNIVEKLGLPYMVVYHIVKGNTWKDV